MNEYFKKILVCLFGALAFSLSLQAAPNKSEDELIQMLRSRDYHTMNDALDRLPHWYPNSTNAIGIIRGLLRSNEVLVITEPDYEKERNASRTGNVTLKPCPPGTLARMTARSLGNYHITPSEEELNAIYKLLNSRDPETVMDGLKALRGMNAPEAVPKIIPLLQDLNPHVVRDACRTLAVLGNSSVIPAIEPLLKNSAYSAKTLRWASDEIKKDAQIAINTLRTKP
ncbi:MAG TPA: HEAT repeat domain-containing protein [Verrucomicrobiae bacterium]|nr:HEAT repeat domain-containing protein [Verrucomicrobiae bacterium]